MLKKLQLHAASFKKCKGPDLLRKLNSSSHDGEGVGSEVSNALRQRANKIIELELLELMCLPNATRLLITWLTNLTKKTIDLGNSQYRTHYNVFTIQRLLNVRREALRHTERGLIHPSYMMGFPLLNFAN